MARFEAPLMRHAERARFHQRAEESRALRLESPTPDPSLRLKNGFAQDAAILGQIETEPLSKIHR